MAKFVFFLSFAMLFTALTAHAGEDPMRSLFKFQQKMAHSGSSTAYMKLGNMYEQGLGTKQDYAKAVEMYQKAREMGNPGANAAIQRVVHLREQRIAAQIQKMKQAAEEQHRRLQAEKHAEEVRKAQLQQAEIQRQARRRAREAAAARRQAQLDAKRRQRAQELQRQAEAQKRAQARAAAATQASEQPSVSSEQQTSQSTKKVVKQSTAQPDAGAGKKDTFRSDPCQGPAARVMSTCN